MVKVTGLKPRWPGDGRDSHALVLAHGIHMDAQGLHPLADAIHEVAPSLSILLFDYDWTQSLVSSGAALASELGWLPHDQISLLGYSMGGLVTRLAASDRPEPRLATIITLATPNNGALTNGQLSALGQEMAAAARLISPSVMSRGVMDLTRAGTILKERRKRAGVAGIVAAKRYASVPALYFHAERSWRPAKTGMGPVAFALDSFRIISMPRPHDGIVTEESCDIVGGRAPPPWSELDFAQYDGAGPPRCHARHIQAEDRDHMSILECPEIADLIALMVIAPNWAAIPSDPDVQVLFP